MRFGRHAASAVASLSNPTQTQSGSRVDSALSALLVLGLGAVVLATILALAVAVVPAEELQAPQPAERTSNAFAVGADTSLSFVLQLGNRLFPEWKEERRVRLHERFVIGDTQYWAMVTKLLPDFRIIDGKPGSVSGQMNNPAVRVMVYRDSTTAADSSWAFQNFPPHFSPRSFFTFQLKEVVGYKDSKTQHTEASQAAKETSPRGDRSFSKKD